MTAAPAEFNVGAHEPLAEEPTNQPAAPKLASTPNQQPSDDEAFDLPNQAAGFRSVISVRMSTDEVAELRVAADALGMKLSTFLRVAALEAARRNDRVLNRDQLKRDVYQLLHANQDMERQLKSVCTQLHAAS